MSEQKQQESQKTFYASPISQDRPSDLTQKQEKNPFIRFAERVFHGKPEQTIRESSIEEPKGRSQTSYTRRVNILLHLTKIQHEIFRFLGHSEEKRYLRVYEDATEEYRRLCRDYGIEPSPIFTQWKHARTTKDSIEEKIQRGEESFFHILAEPANALHSQGLFLETTKEKLLKTLLSSDDLSKVDFDGKQIPPELQQTLSRQIVHAKIAALALYDKFHWREFTRQMMNNHAGRFSTEGGIKQIDNNQIDQQLFAKNAEETLRRVLMRGVPYRLEREHWKNNNNRQEYVYSIDSVPVFVPLGMQRDESGNLHPIFPPTIDVESFSSSSLTEARKLLEQAQAGKNATLQIIDIDEDGPGSQIAFMNNPEQSRIRQRLMEQSTPLSITIFRYKNGEIYVSGISDHTTTDGVPLADHIVGQFMKEMPWGETKPLPFATGENNLPSEEMAETLSPYTEYTVALNLSSIQEFRQLLKDAERNKMPIMDNQGNPLDISLFTIGTIISILEGQRHMTLAREAGIARQETKGTLVHQESLSEQLMEVSITDLVLPDNPEEWFFVQDGKIVINAGVIEALQKARVIFSQQAHAEDNTETVRQVFRLPKILWRLNAWVSQRILGRFATENVGAVMVSVLNPKHDVIGGPALVPEWQNLAATYGRLGKDGTIPMKIKIGGNQRKAIQYLEQYRQSTQEWNKRFSNHIQSMREKISFPSP